MGAPVRPCASSPGIWSSLSATMELPGGMWRDEVLRELGAQGDLSRLELFLKMALMDLSAAGSGTNGFRHNWG